MGVVKKYFLVIIFILYLRVYLLCSTSIEYVTSFMEQNGSNGKQSYDNKSENLFLAAPTFFLSSKVSENTDINASFVFDSWSSASEHIFDTSTGASQSNSTVSNPDANSGASSPIYRDKDSDDHDNDYDDNDDNEGSESGSESEKSKRETRKAFNIGVSHKFKYITIAPSIGFSKEFDYESFSQGISLQKSFAEDNFSVLLLAYNYDDKILPYDITSKVFYSWAKRKTKSYIINISQILTPKTLFFAGAGISLQSGFLTGTRNTVDLAGVRASEVLPHNRSRYFYTAKVIQGINDVVALHFGYRKYFDSWNISSDTFEPSLFISFNDDKGLLRLLYRYYSQVNAKYYADSFSGINEYMTSDSDLSKFDANEFGFNISHTYELKGFFKSIELGIGFLYYERTNGLNSKISQISIKGTM